MKTNADIFKYNNYRLFLKDYFSQKKEVFKGFTFRLWAEIAGFSSPSFIKLVIEGKKNLSKESVLKIAKSLKLNKKATEYFENTVFFNQSELLDHKYHYLDKMDKFRKTGNPEKIKPNDYDYLKKWYHPVIREMVDFPDFKEDPKWINERLNNRVGTDKIIKSLKFLIDSGFIIRDKDGRLVKKDKTLATGKIQDQEIISTIARKHHLNMVDFARKAIESIPVEKRNVTNTTLNLSKQGYEIALKRISQLREELLELASSDDNADQVFQLNVNLFPLTREVKK